MRGVNARGWLGAGEERTIQRLIAFAVFAGVSVAACAAPPPCPGVPAPQCVACPAAEAPKAEAAKPVVAPTPKSKPHESTSGPLPQLPGWILAGTAPAHYEVALDTSIKRDGKASARMVSISDPGDKFGCRAATRKPLNDRERVVVVFETNVQDESAREQLVDEVRKAVRTATGLSIDDVVPLEAGVLPKTSSGKLKRTATRELYETGQLFMRTSARKGDPLDTAKEIAKSQLGYVRHALFRDKK